eukprot:1144545-Prymnesium_polylepis.1
MFRVSVCKLTGPVKSARKLQSHAGTHSPPAAPIFTQTLRYWSRAYSAAARQHVPVIHSLSSAPQQVGSPKPSVPMSLKSSRSSGSASPQPTAGQTNPRWRHRTRARCEAAGRPRTNPVAMGARKPKRVVSARRAVSEKRVD